MAAYKKGDLCVVAVFLVIGSILLGSVVLNRNWIDMIYLGFVIFYLCRFLYIKKSQK